MAREADWEWESERQRKVLPNGDDESDHRVPAVSEQANQYTVWSTLDVLASCVARRITIYDIVTPCTCWMCGLRLPAGSHHLWLITSVTKASTLHLSNSTSGTIIRNLLHCFSTPPLIHLPLHSPNNTAIPNIYTPICSQFQIIQNPRLTMAWLTLSWHWIPIISTAATNKKLMHQLAIFSIPNNQTV